MSKVSLRKVMRVKNSVNTRLSNVTRKRLRYRFGGGSTAPLHDVDGAFDHELRVLQDVYEKMSDRIEKALDDVKVEL